MTYADHSIPYGQGSGASFHHVILAICIVFLLLIGTDSVSIVFWQMGLAKKIEIFVMVPILAITVLYYRHLLRGAFASPELSMLVIMAFFSTAWSDYPIWTFERAVPLVVTSALALSLGSMMSLRGLLLFIATFFALAMVLSMAAIIAFPQARGIPPWGETWNGIYAHKNGLGLASMLALLTCYYASHQFKGKLRTVFIFATILALVLLVASESRTAQIIALVSMTALITSQLLPRLETIWTIGYILFAVFIIGFSAFLLASTIAEPLFALIGRKPTLSERIPIWELVWPNIMERFWLGYGYAAHWFESAPHLSVYSSRANLGFMPHYSHNGLLETFLNTGFIGVVLLTCVFARFFFSVFYGLRYIKQRDAIVFTFLLGMTFFFINITESSILDRMNASWIFFVAFTTKMNLVAKALRESAKADYAAIHPRVSNIAAN